MARSLADAPQGQVRGFVPPQNDEERTLMRHIEDMARVAQTRGIPRCSAFLSDRKQALARAALNRVGFADFAFTGGWPGAERCVLCLGQQPDEAPITCLALTCRLTPGAQPPQHKDYLGSLLGLALKREALGDILLPPEQPGQAWVFALENAAKVILAELDKVGNTGVQCSMVLPGQLPAFSAGERKLQSATVSSLRLDAVLAAMLRCSRGQAAQLIAAGRVEINHVAASSAHAPVYVQDVFTIRGKGRYQLVELPGVSKKGRNIMTFFQF